MGQSRQFYVRLARGILRGRPELARRYLALCRRRKVLRSGVREAQGLATHKSPLADVGFRPPLSVAGCRDSLVVVKAEGIALAGVPVAFDLDGRGRHRGTPVERVAGRLGVSADEVLDLYQAYMAACPRLLAGHPKRRYARLPRLIDTVRRQMGEAEQALLVAYAEREREPTLELAVTASCVLGTSRFMVFAHPDSLAGALEAAERAKSSLGVVVGYSQSDCFRVDKRPVATAWGRGAGVAVLRREDLETLLDGDGVVGIECLPETWRGWRAGRDPQAPARTFYYYEAGAET